MTTPQEQVKAHREKWRNELRQRVRYWKRVLLDTYIELGGTEPARRKLDAQSLWLACCELTGSESRACDASEVTRNRVSAWKREDPVFSKVLPQVNEARLDRLVGEATRRAVEGVMVPKYHQGQLIGYELKYSDSILLTLLKAANPAMFGEAKGGTRTTDGEERRKAVLNALSASPEALAAAEKLAAILEGEVEPPLVEGQ